MSTFSLMTGDSKNWARACSDGYIDHYALWDLIEEMDSINQWRPLQLKFGEGEVSDFPPSEILGRLCSEKLVQVLRPFTKDVIFAPVSIERDGFILHYYFMHFAECPNVLDVDKTSWLDGDFVSPHLMSSAASRYPYFCLRKLSPTVVVRNDVKEAIESSGFSGIGFSEIPSS